MKDGKITDDNRIMESLPTIKYLLKQNAKVILFQNTRFADIISNDGQININDKCKTITKRESKNDPALGKYWASLGDIFVMMHLKLFIALTLQMLVLPQILLNNV